MYQVVGGECLNQTSLPVTASPEDDALHEVGAAASDHNINRALFACVLSRRRASLDGAGHLRELTLSFFFRKRANLFLEHFLGCRDPFHDLPVEKPANGSDICHLRVIL